MGPLGGMSATHGAKIQKNKREQEAHDQKMALKDQESEAKYGFASRMSNIKEQEAVAKANQALSHKDVKFKETMGGPLGKPAMPMVHMPGEQMDMGGIDALTGQPMSGKDTIPAMMGDQPIALSPGEAIIPESSAQDPKNKPAIAQMVEEGREGYNSGSTAVGYSMGSVGLKPIKIQKPKKIGVNRTAVLPGLPGVNRLGFAGGRVGMDDEESQAMSDARRFFTPEMSGPGGGMMLPQTEQSVPMIGSSARTPRGTGLMDYIFRPASEYNSNVKQQNSNPGAPVIRGAQPAGGVGVPELATRYPPIGPEGVNERILSGQGQGYPVPADPPSGRPTEAQVINSESGGDPGAQSRWTTARGLHQMTDDSRADVEARYPGYAKRDFNDVAVQKDYRLAYIDILGGQLNAKGITPTANAINQAWVVGAGGLSKIRAANPNALLDDILGFTGKVNADGSKQRVTDINPNLAGKTAGQFLSDPNPYSRSGSPTASKGQPVPAVGGSVASKGQPVPAVGGSVASVNGGKPGEMPQPSGMSEEQVRSLYNSMGSSGEIINASGKVEQAVAAAEGKPPAERKGFLAGVISALVGEHGLMSGENAGRLGVIVAGGLLSGMTFGKAFGMAAKNTLQWHDQQQSERVAGENADKRQAASDTRADKRQAASDTRAEKAQAASDTRAEKSQVALEDRAARAARRKFDSDESTDRRKLYEKAVDDASKIDWKNVPNMAMRVELTDRFRINPEDSMEVRTAKHRGLVDAVHRVSVSKDAAANKPSAETMAVKPTTGERATSRRLNGNFQLLTKDGWKDADQVGWLSHQDWSANEKDVENRIKNSMGVREAAEAKARLKDPKFTEGQVQAQVNYITAAMKGLYNKLGGSMNPDDFATVSETTMANLPPDVYLTKEELQRQAFGHALYAKLPTNRILYNDANGGKRIPAVDLGKFAENVQKLAKKNGLEIDQQAGVLEKAYILLDAKEKQPWVAKARNTKSDITSAFLLWANDIDNPVNK